MVPECSETPRIIAGRSITATRLPSFAAAMAPFCPAGPLPITTRSYLLVARTSASMLPSFRSSGLPRDGRGGRRRWRLRLRFGRLLPLQDLQIADGDGVQDRDERERADGRDRQASHLHVAEAGPEGAAVQRQRDEAQDSGGDGHGH